MITAIAIVRDDGDTTTIANPKTMARLNAMLALVADAYDDDPGVSDLDDEQPADSVSGFDLGDVRLARRLTR